MTARTLVLLRHAKAERPGGLADAQRPLTARGHADAAAAGAWLARHDLVPQVVLCSPAARTRQTWHGVAVAIAEAIGGAGPVVRYQRELYSGGVPELMDLVRAVEKPAGCVLVIGHNPTMSEASALLDGAAAAAAVDLRTSGLAVHRLAGGWADCGPGAAPLTETHTARG